MSKLWPSTWTEGIFHSHDDKNVQGSLHSVVQIFQVSLRSCMVTRSVMDGVFICSLGHIGFYITSVKR